MSGLSPLSAAGGALPVDPGAAAPLAADASTAAAPPVVVRGTVPGRPVIAAPAVVDGARRPVAASVYGPIASEMATADWNDLGLDPLRYTEDRLSRPDFLDPLLADPERRVVLHRDALKIGQVRSIDGSRAINVAHRRAKDYPGRVYYDREDKAYHVVGIAGDDWQRQTMFMLAAAGVPADRIDVEGVFDPASRIADDLRETLKEHDFASVTVGTMGELTKAVERVLRKRLQPEHEAKVVGEMTAFLADRAQTARADKRPRWEARRDRLAELIAQGGSPAEQLAAVGADPVLRGVMSAHLRRAEDGPERSELPIQTRTRSGDLLSHRVLEVEGRKHLLVHIGGAHADLSYHAIKHVLAEEPTLAQVNVYGSAGSFRDDVPPDTFIRPTTFDSHEEDRGPLAGVTNHAALDGAVDVAHTNVSTLLREHRAGLEAMVASGAESVDMESYHVARAAADAGRPVELRALLRISDVPTSAHLGAHRDDRAGTSDYEARRRGEEAVVTALGLVTAEAPTPAADLAGGQP